MKKKLLSLILAVSMVTAVPVCVSAAGSKTAIVEVSKEYADQYESEAITEKSLEELKKTEAEAAAIIEKILKDAGDLSALVEAQPELKEALEGKELLGNFVNLKEKAGAKRLANGKYEISLSVPAMTKKTKDFGVLYFNKGEKDWEVLDPSEIDEANKEIRAELEELSIVAVVAKVTK